MTDNTTGFAKTSKSKADFIDFIASTYYAQNCAHCRSVQGIALIAVFVGMFATSAGVIGGLKAATSASSVLLGYFGGMFIGSAICIGCWLMFFSLWKGVTDKIADNAPSVETGVTTTETLLDNDDIPY